MKTTVFNLKLWIAVIAIQFLTTNINAQVGDLIWEDNFDTLNTSIWNPINGNGCEIGLCGWGNAELEYYSENNISVESIPGELGNNALVLEAKRETIGTNAYTSGKVDSENKLSVHYGLIEIRMQTPPLETGLWPAAWLLGTANVSWPSKGEIDMMEMGHAVAERANQGHPNTRADNYVGANAIFANEDGSAASIAYDVNYNKPYVANASMANRFMTYRLYWEPTQLRFTVVDNGTEYDLYEGPLPVTPDGLTSAFTKPFYFLMNLAVGGNFTDAATNNQVTAALPSKLLIDYVRVYEWNGHGAVEFDYGELEPESGPFGVFTENTPVNNSLNFGLDADIFVWGGTMQDGTTQAYEGNEVIAWETLNANNWFGGGVISSFGKDMSGYVEEGTLKFNIKIPGDVSFRIGITDNFTNESWITFNANQTKYGLVRNGEWGQVEIPLEDFAGLIAFQNINYMFAIASLDGAFPASTFQLGIDNIVWDDGNASSTIDVTGVLVSPSNTTLLEGETVQLNETIAPTNATNKSVSWSSSNSSIASVNSNGLVTSNTAGTTTITATTQDGNFSAATTITVKEKIIPGGNLALNGTASQSTTAFNGSASRAIDGNTSGIWTNASVTHTNAGVGQWWKVDLEREYEIGVINIWNRTNCCLSRLNNITVSVENNNGNVLWSETIRSSSATTLSVNAGGVSGRVIKITQNQNQPLSLAEVQVYENDGTTVPKNFVPDPNKTYYIDVPVHNLRLAATGNSEDPFTTATNTTGANVEWKFVAKGNGSWHIRRAAGGTKPGFRSDNSANADMQPTSSVGSFTYFDFAAGATNGTYFMTLPNGPNNFKRAQINSSGAVRMVSTVNAGEWESFKFTEVEDSNPSYYNKIEAEDYVAMNGIRTEETSDDDTLNVGFIDANDWMDYTINIPTTGVYTINSRVASVPGNAAIQFQVNGRVLATTNINTTGGWQTWRTFSTNINLSAGIQTLRLYSVGSSFNINWFEITNQASGNRVLSKATTIKDIKLYPNPVNDILNLQLGANSALSKIEIIDVIGKKQISQNVSAKSTTINMGKLASGLYFLHLYDGDTLFEVRKILKK